MQQEPSYELGSWKRHQFFFVGSVIFISERDVFEMLKGDRRGQYSIRINDQYRICFEWNGQDAINLEIVDYH